MTKEEIKKGVKRKACKSARKVILRMSVLIAFVCNLCILQQERKRGGGILPFARGDNFASESLGQNDRNVF